MITQWTHSRPQSHFHSVTRWKVGSGLDEKREWSDWFLRKLLFRGSWTVFVRQNYSINIYQHKYFVLRNISLWKLLRRVLKRPNSRVCALETTASFLALPVPCIPGPQNRYWTRSVTQTIFCPKFTSKQIRTFSFSQNT
jgi:hypothetical protein